MTSGLESGSTQIRKAAIVISALDEVTGEQVLDQMPPALAEVIRQHLSRCEPVSWDERREALREYRDLATIPDVTPAARTPVFPSEDALQRDPLSAESTFPMPFAERDARPAHQLRHHCPKAAETGEDADTPFRFLETVPIETLARAVQEERPQAVAMLLGHLPSREARALLESLPGAQRLAVLRRAAAVQPVSSEIVEDIAAGLRFALQLTRSPQHDELDAPDGTPTFLDVTDEEPLDVLASQTECGNDTSSSASLAGDELVFDHLQFLPAGMLRVVSGRIPAAQWAIALAGATNALRERILEVLPVAQAGALQEELRQLGPFRVSDVELVQRSIVQRFRAECERSSS